MTKARFTEEFKQEAIKQVLERGYTVPDLAKRLGSFLNTCINSPLATES